MVDRGKVKEDKNKNKIEVFVFCAAYNHEPYIRSALDGFVMQKTSFRFQLIVHDDASTDRTPDIVREYEAQYPDIFYAIYETENQYSQGKSYRRELTESLPYGKYVAFCEGDDYWTDPLKLQKQYDFMEAHPEYSCCTHETISVDVPTGKSHKFTRGMTNGDITFKAIAIWDNNPYGFPQTSSYFMRKEYSLCPIWMVRDGVGDFPTLLNCAMNGRVYFMEDVMSTYRSRSIGSWTEKTNKSGEFLIKHFTNIIQMLEQLDIETNYKYSDDLFWAVAYKKREMIALSKKFKLIYYDNYNGKERRYAWGLTASIPYMIARKVAINIIPKQLKAFLQKLRHRG
jgi:glycosyltransferase involved in cell wall biosynthesis